MWTQFSQCACGARPKSVPLGNKKWSQYRQASGGCSDTCVASQKTASSCQTPIQTAMWVFIGILGLAFIWFLRKVGFFGWVKRKWEEWQRKQYEEIFNKYQIMRYIQREFVNARKKYAANYISAKEKSRDEYLEQIKDYRENIQNAGAQYEKEVETAAHFLENATSVATNLDDKYGTNEKTGKLIKAAILKIRNSGQPELKEIFSLPGETRITELKEVPSTDEPYFRF